MRRIDLTGQRFGMLAVVGFSHVDSGRMACWKCLCDCGRHVVTVGKHLRLGKTRSCGCLQKERAKEYNKLKRRGHIAVAGGYGKMCGRCKKNIPLGGFSKDRSNWDGFFNICKLCINKRQHNRYRENIYFKIKASLYRRTRSAIKNNIKSLHTAEFIGCTIDELKAHLQNKFYGEMSWENYGPYWHIDHIKPCSKFDLSDPEQQKACFHYTNLQPLTATDNLRKSNRYEG